MDAKANFWTVIFTGDEGTAGYLHLWSAEERVGETMEAVMNFDINQGKSVWNESASSSAERVFRPTKFKIYKGWIKIDNDNFAKLADEVRKS
jgi:hypothetical protein